MTSKREKLQYAYVFFADLLTMAVSVLLAWLITDGLFGVLIPYTSTDWLQTLCLLFVAFVVTFFFFDQDKNIVTRSENEEIGLSLRFNIAFGLVYAGCMLLAKATMLDSRYFAVTVPAVNAVLLPFSHAILKRLLIRFQRSWGMETLVGVVTTSDRAERLISEIRKDWSRRVVGVSLLEATPAAISTRVCGVEVKATFDDFMDWIRREALDEVYVDVPMDSGESFIPYLDEMESMGLTVHFRLPLLDRIEEACCDETSAARLSRSLTHLGIVPFERKRSVCLIENDAVCVGKAALRLSVFAPAVADIRRIVARHSEERKVERVIACALEREDALLKAEGVDHV